MIDVIRELAGIFMIIFFIGYFFIETHPIGKLGMITLAMILSIIFLITILYKYFKPSKKSK